MIQPDSLDTHPPSTNRCSLEPAPITGRLELITYGLDPNFLLAVFTGTSGKLIKGGHDKPAKTQLLFREGTMDTFSVAGLRRELPLRFCFLGSWWLGWLHHLRRASVQVALLNQGILTRRGTGFALKTRVLGKFMTANDASGIQNKYLFLRLRINFGAHFRGRWSRSSQVASLVSFRAKNAPLLADSPPSPKRAGLLEAPSSLYSKQYNIYINSKHYKTKSKPNLVVKFYRIR